MHGWQVCVITGRIKAKSTPAWQWLNRTASKNREGIGTGSERSTGPLKDPHPREDLWIRDPAKKQKRLAEVRPAVPMNWVRSDQSFLRRKNEFPLSPIGAAC